MSLDWSTVLKLLSPWLVVFAAATVTLLAAASRRLRTSPLVAVVALAGVVAAFVLSWKLWIGGSGPILATLAFDRLSFFGWLLILGITALTILMSSSYLTARHQAHPEYYGLLLLSAIGMGVLIAGYDLITIFIGLETMSVAVYALAGFFRERPQGNEAALKYFLTGAFASAFLLLGIAFLFGTTGTTDVGMIAAQATTVLSGELRSSFLFGLAMLVVGFGFKVAAVPFHAWAPDVYDGAPTPITAFMATAVKVAAFVAFLRIAMAVLVPAGVLWEHLAWGLAVATMLVGNLAAIVQDNIKRMLAYSSIAHAGYLLVAFTALGQDPTGLSRGVIFYLVAYLLMTLGAFAVVTATQEAGEAADINLLAGLSRRRPWAAAMLALFLFSLTGFPPTIGFFGKYYLFLGAMKAGFIWLVVVALLNSVISAYYYLRPIVVMYFHEPRETEEKHALPLASPLVAVIAITAISVLLFGLLPTNLLAIVEHSVMAFPQ